MKRLALFAVLLMSFSNFSAFAQQEENFDYFSTNRQMIRNGVQAVLMCNGLFTSNRSLAQVFEQELAYLTPTRFTGPVGTVNDGEYEVDYDLKAVAIGGPTTGTTIRAAFREGIGCVVMAPDQSFDDIDTLPKLDLPYSDIDAAMQPWPNGDRVEKRSLPDNIDGKALQAASDWAFDRETPEQDTLSLLVVYKGDIILERYAPGIEVTTRTRTWSTAKSIAATLIGMLVDDGRMNLDDPLGFEWLPDVRAPEMDPRNEITLRHALNMSTGLDPLDNYGMEYVTGSGMSYWAGASSVNGARRRAVVREPGTYWDYENYDTLLAVLAMKKALGNDNTYQEFPRRALLDKLGMRNTLVSADRFHDFILSSQVYTNARDLARFGLLYLQGGIWNGEQIVSREWIDFVTSPAPATAERGNFYGGQWWLVPDDRDDVPPTAYSTAGNRGQYVVVVPTHDVVIVRRGLDYGRQGFNQFDLTREVLKAIDPATGGSR
ncbi:MAG: serine hydrolase domain-containing protein [Woeseiaceae bacterium]